MKMACPGHGGQNQYFHANPAQCPSAVPVCGPDDRGLWRCYPKACDRHTPTWHGSSCPEQMIWVQPPMDTEP